MFFKSTIIHKQLSVLLVLLLCSQLASANCVSDQTVCNQGCGGNQNCLYQCLAAGFACVASQSNNSGSENGAGSDISFQQIQLRDKCSKRCRDALAERLPPGRSMRCVDEYECTRCVDDCNARLPIKQNTTTLQQQIEDERRRQNEADRQQQEALRLRNEEYRRQVEAYNQQQATQFNQRQQQQPTYNNNLAAQPVAKTHEKVWIGDLTSLCARYSDPRANFNATHYTMTNGCNEPIKVWIGDDQGANTVFGSLMELAPGRSEKSWWLNTKYRGIKYIACKSSVGDKQVYLDKQSNNCFYIN